MKNKFFAALVGLVVRLGLALGCRIVTTLAQAEGGVGHEV